MGHGVASGVGQIKFFWKNNEAISLNRYPQSNHRAQARDGLVSFVISVASEMITLKRFVPLSKRSSSIFSRKNSFYPMPDATFLKRSGAKLDLL